MLKNDLLKNDVFVWTPNTITLKTTWVLTLKKQAHKRHTHSQGYISVGLVILRFEILRCFRSITSQRHQPSSHNALGKDGTVVQEGSEGDARQRAAQTCFQIMKVTFCRHVITTPLMPRHHCIISPPRHHHHIITATSSQLYTIIATSSPYHCSHGNRHHVINAT
jgi:hypothetical protein